MVVSRGTTTPKLRTRRGGLKLELFRAASFRSADEMDTSEAGEAPRAGKDSGAVQLQPGKLARSKQADRVLQLRGRPA